MYMKVSTDFNTTKSKVRRSTESIAIYTETESVLATKFLLHKTQTQLFACCVYNKFRELLQTFVNFSLRQNILYIYMKTDDETYDDLWDDEMIAADDHTIQSKSSRKRGSWDIC